MPGDVNLPKWTRADAVTAAKRGLTREEYVAEQTAMQERLAKIAETAPVISTESIKDVERAVGLARPRPGDRIELGQGEYEALCLVASLVKSIVPDLEQTGLPATKRVVWQQLTTTLEEINTNRWGGTYAEGVALDDLIDILHDTGS